MAQRAFACPKCKTKLTAPEGVDRFRCPNCKTVLTAPAQPPQAPAQPQAQAPPPAPAPPPRPTAPAPPQARLPEPQEQLEGRVLAGYRISRLIGSGGMGTVYEAVQEGLKRRVALKVLPVGIAQDTAFLTGFKREAQATAKLNHPNIIQIFDIIEDKGFNFFSMEFVDGESLSDRLKREGRLAIVDALQIVAQVGTALDHANEHMLIHRDIKPSNILLTQRGDVKLADLGLSKSLEETAVGVVRGTHGGPVYMAPEFAQNPQIADCRSDIYALGAVLYHMLTGQPPFPGPTIADLIKQHAHSPLPSARAVVPELPEAVDELLQKMCAKDPAERCQTYEELLGQVQLLLKATLVRHPRIPSAASHRPRRWSGSRWLPIAIVAALVLAALAAAAIFIVPKLLGPSEKATAAPRTDVVTGDPEEPGEIEVVAPPPEKPATDDPAGIVPTPPDEGEPEGPKEPDKPEEPKEPGEAEPPEKEPDKPEAPAREGELAKVQERADALAGEMKFGEAIAALGAFAEGNDDEALKAKVAEAREAIEIQAAQAFAGARGAAMGLVTKGKVADAVTVLQGVVETFGTDKEVGLAKAAIQAIGRYQQGLKALADAARKAAAGAKTAGARAAEQARFAEAVEPIEELLAKWELAEALKQLDALKADDPAVGKQIAQRKAAIQALAALQGKMIRLIKTAKPRLRKSDLRIRGLNGDLTDADESAITIKTPMKVEKLPWAKLRDVSAKLLAQRAGKTSSAEDLLGTALILRLLGDAEEAEKFLQRAAALGAQTDALGDLKAAAAAAQREAQAAKALAAAVRLAASGQHRKAAAALAAYQEKFEDTDYFASAEKLYKAAKALKPFAPPAAPKVTPKPKPKKPTPTKPTTKQPAPKKPKPKPKTPPKKADPKAVAVYQSAVAAYRERNFDECRKRLDELKAKFPKDAILVDGRRKPSVPAMVKTIASQGDTLTVSPGDKLRSLADALAALKKPNSTIEIRASSRPYGPGALVSGEAAQGLIIRGVGERNPRFDGGGGGGKPIIKVFPDTRGVWIGGLTLQSAEVGIAIDEGCRVTIRDCFAVKGIGAALDIRGEAVLDIADSVLKIDAVNGAAIQGCCLLCGDTSIDYSRLRHCILVGKDIGILGSSLTDCLIIGSVRVRDRAALNHVTITKTATIERDIRGARITNSILPTIEFDKIGDIRAWNRKTKKELETAAEAVNLTITSSLLFRHRGDLPQVIAKTKDLLEGKIAFRDPRRHDYRLPDSSRYLKKATDKTALGCRFTPEMLKRLRYVPH